MLFVHLTRYASGRRIPVNPAAIAYLDICDGGAVVAFASGESIRVSENPDEILEAITVAETRSRTAAPKAPLFPAPPAPDAKRHDAPASGGHRPKRAA